jgi:hypothetical protein
MNSETTDALQSAVFRKFPPIAELVMASMAAVITGGIYIAAHIPVVPGLTLPSVLLVVAAVLTAAAVVLLVLSKEFPWKVLFRVAKWGLLPYLVISGMLEFVFLYDHIRGGELVVMTISLVLFALDIPFLLGFTVARYDTGGDVL